MRPDPLGLKFGQKIAFVILFGRIGLGHGPCRWTRISIEEPAPVARDDGCRIILREIDAIGGCGSILPGPSAPIK